MEPLVIAHRGGQMFAPEHSLEAYSNSLALGVDGWECDVRLSRDRQLVCIHDRRIDRLSEGKGSVARYTLAELRKLRFISSEPRHAETAEQPVLSLDELLGFFVDVGRAKQLLIETKHPSRGGKKLEEHLAASLKRFGLGVSDSVSVMSFWPPALARTQTFLPRIRTVQLWGSIPPFYPPGPSPVVGPALRVLRSFPEYVTHARANGKELVTWTVNTPEDLAFVLDLGIESVITDDPAMVLSRLRPPPV